MIIITHVATVWKTSDMVDFDQSIFPGLTRYTRCCLSIPPWKHQKTFRFFDVFKGYRQATPGCNFFKNNFFQE